MAITVFQGGPTFFILRLLLIRLVLIAPHISFSRKFFRTTILISSSQKALYVLSLIIFEAFVLLQWLSSSRRVFTHSLTTFSPTYSPGVNFVSFLKSWLQFWVLSTPPPHFCWVINPCQLTTGLSSCFINGKLKVF